MGNLINQDIVFPDVEEDSQYYIYQNDPNKITKRDMDAQMSYDQNTATPDDEKIMKTFISQSSAYLAKKKPMYDFSTKNRSFIALYKDLKKLGIRNNKFFLILYDQDLRLIDPYSPLLPKDMQLKVYLECLINPWYFLREILRIPEAGKPIEIHGGTRYRIDRSNLSCWYLYLNGVDHYQSKPRQQGKTQDCVAKFLYAYLFGAMSSDILFFNKDQDQANMNLYRMKCQRDMLPSYLQMRMVLNEDGKYDKGTENVRSISNPVTGCRVMTMGKATNKETAMRMGRGATAPLQYYDEFDFIPKQTEIMNAAAFAYSTAARAAKENHSLYCRILSSTPGDLDSESGAAAAEYVSKMLRWEDRFYDIPIEKIKEIVNSPSYNRIIYSEYSWKQLKLTMDWYEEQCGLVSFNEEVIMREIDLQRIHGSDLSPFRRADVMYLLQHVHKPIQEVDLSKNLCPFKIYERLKRTTPYMCCVDPAEGLAGDNSAVTFINPYTLKPAVEFKSPYISQPDLCDLLVEFMDRYCPKCMIIIESNRGVELINCFRKTRYEYQLYYDDNKLNKAPEEKHDHYGRLRREAYERRAFGLSTGRNRDEYMRVLETLVVERKDLLISEYLVDDIAGLIRKPPHGRVEAGPGKHDDSVMSYLFGIYLYNVLPAEKLYEYGIERGGRDDSDEYSTDEEKVKKPFDGREQVRKLKELLPGLPPEMQELIRGSLTRSEADDIRENVAEIQRAKDMIENPDPTGGYVIPDFKVPPSMIGDEYWNGFDAGLQRMNDSMLGGGIDIEDIIDN